MNKVVYIHRRKDNLKVIYVGMGNPNRPFKVNGRCKDWRDVNNTVGITTEIVKGNLTVEDAYELEKFIIGEYGLSNLLNKSIGGQGATGYKHTEEAKINISNNHSRFWKGKKLSRETRNLISKALTGLDRDNKTSSKNIEQLNKNLTLIREYKSTAEATRITGINNTSIISCANGNRKSAGGFIWKYK